MMDNMTATAIGFCPNAYADWALKEASICNISKRLKYNIRLEMDARTRARERAAQLPLVPLPSIQNDDRRQLRLYF